MRKLLIKHASHSYSSYSIKYSSHFSNLSNNLPFPPPFFFFFFASVNTISKPILPANSENEAFETYDFYPVIDFTHMRQHARCVNRMGRREPQLLLTSQPPAPLQGIPRARYPTSTLLQGTLPTVLVEPGLRGLVGME